ncbi:YheC/YheD family protein [Paenibacillus alvei]|uniref:YheC/YheD family endospore coat-associated protein n=1 Tax=Paenibacillus alvei TaxID=44250 RepID=UPI002280DA59|nr:YheC/YheD family protein [Paenibacillus alvei]MCY7483566.1 YheC/YheD family protein [Paenibacillus alvei]
MSDNRIGILFSARMLREFINGKLKFESTHLYEEAARQYGLVPCFFRIEDVHLRQMEVDAYVKGPSGYVRCRMPVPSVIHNRAIYKRSFLHARVRSLVQANIILFNEVNRYRKISIYNLLRTDPLLVTHLPKTLVATSSAISDFMTRYGALILKPDNSSVGLGLTKTERTSKGWRTTYMLRTSAGRARWRTVDLPAGELPAAVKRDMLKKVYLVQQLLPLARYKGRPFDLRVSVQRDGSKQWQITGIIGKVAPPYTFVTNAARGGTTYRFEQLAASSFPHLAIDVLRDRICRFSLRIASRLSKSLPQLADLGLDIGLSPEGLPLFIECNGKDQRYGFREAHLLDCWKATYANPIAYGAALLHQFKG